MTPKLIFLTHNNILIKIPYIQIIEYIENFIYLYVEILYRKMGINFYGKLRNNYYKIIKKINKKKKK